MDGQHTWLSQRDQESPTYPVSIISARLVNIYNIVGRTWMASIPGLSLRDQGPPAYPVSIVLARLVSL